jgi:NADPH:quinone reductase-like Zn-dependent oxidoreductase
MRVKAARLVGHGQPLRIEEIELPEPGPHDVVLDVAYSGVNPVDMSAAQGQVAAAAPAPRTLGTEGAGTADGRPVVVRGHGIGTARGAEPTR